MLGAYIPTCCFCLSFGGMYARSIRLNARSIRSETRKERPKFAYRALVSGQFPAPFQASYSLRGARLEAMGSFRGALVRRSSGGNGSYSVAFGWCSRGDSRPGDPFSSVS